MTIKRCYPVLVGASVGENQLIQNGNFADGTTGWGTNNATLTASNNVATYTRTTDGLSSILQNNIPYKANHKYFVSATLKASVDNTSRFRFYSSQADSNWYQFSLTANIESAITTIFSPSWSNEEGRFYIYYSYPSSAIGDTLTVKNVMMTDLTQKFGSAIADYVYSLEQATAGSGIAWLRSYGFISDDYIPYNTGTIESVEATAKVVRDENGENAVTYPLGSDVLRGIFKLDANNQLYADGDRKEADGTITRYYGTRDHQEGDESLPDTITDGTTTVYKLTTPTKETSTPFTSPQLVYPDGTEEFITENNVPVGHETKYQL